MSDSTPSIESEFSAQLQALILEAEQQMEGRAKGKEKAESQDSVINLSMEPDLAVPDSSGKVSATAEITSGMEDLKKRGEGHSASLDKIEKAVNAQEGLPQLMNEVKQVIERKNAVNKAMFDALHAELKGYKDGFILDAVLRPVIRDVIALHDDAADIFTQLNNAAALLETDSDKESLIYQNVKNSATRAEHHLHFLIEVLERLNVTRMTPGDGKLNKHLQRAVSVESTSNSEEEQDIIKTVKYGFMWKERVFRPEEVVIKKWQPVGGDDAQQEEIFDFVSKPSTS